VLLTEKSFLLQNQSIYKKKKKTVFFLAFLSLPPSFLFIFLSPHSFLSGRKEIKNSFAATVNLYCQSTKLWQQFGKINKLIFQASHLYNGHKVNKSN